MTTSVAGNIFVGQTEAPLVIRPYIAKMTMSELHAVMAVESSFQLSEMASPKDKYLAALWSVYDFKRYQQRDADEGDWVLPPRPVVSFHTEAQARSALHKAMQAWDEEQAEILKEVS